MEGADFAIEDVLSLGDVGAWSPDDWIWDSKAFTATPAEGSLERAAKRQCGVHSTLPGNVLLPGQLSDKGPTESASAFTNFHLPGIGSHDTIWQVNPEAPSRPHSAVENDRSAPSCQVESCGRDLSHLSTYHQRCRICEIHIKESSFMRAGIMQRFCQQCGRCHPMDAFQGQKRSCIEQLAKHNARRRRQKQNKKATEFGLQQSYQTASDQDPSFLQSSSLATGAQTFKQPSAPLQSAFLDDVTAQAASTGSALATDSQPFTSQEGLPQEASACQNEGMATFEDAKPCDCGCVTQSVKAGPGQSSKSGLKSSQPQHAADDSSAPPSSGPLELAHGAQEADTFTKALAFLDHRQGPAGIPQYRSQTLSMQLSVKLFKCTPADLPKDMRQQLTGWLNSAPAGAECLIRPGCVHAHLRLVLSPSQIAQVRQDGVATLVQHLLRQGQPLWGDNACAVEMEGQLAMLEHGRLQGIRSQAQHPASATRLHIQHGRGTVEAAHEAPGRPATWQQSREGPAAAYLGSSTSLHIAANYGDVERQDLTWSCHMDGAHLPCHCSPGGQPQELNLHIGMPHAQMEGAVLLNTYKRGRLIHTQLVLLCPQQELVTELQALSARDVESGNHLINDLALLTEGLLSQQARRPLLDRLCKFACQSGLQETLQWILARHGGECLQPTGAAQWSMQHICVQHHTMACLATILKHEMAEANPEGPHGITPLHLAAVRNSQEASMLIADHLPLDAWTEILAEDGQSPSDFCLRASNSHLNAVMCGRVDEGPPGPVGLANKTVPGMPTRDSTACELVLTPTADREMQSCAAMSLDLNDSELSYSSHVEECTSSVRVVHHGRSAACHGVMGRSDVCLGRSLVCLPASVASH